jgi:hypothetical protein
VTAVLRPGVLLCAVLICSPALFNAFVAGTLETETALKRLGLAVVLCAAARAVLLVLTRAPAPPPEGEIVDERRRTPVTGLRAGKD